MGAKIAQYHQCLQVKNQMSNNKIGTTLPTKNQAKMYQLLYPVCHSKKEVFQTCEAGKLLYK